MQCPAFGLRDIGRPSDAGNVCCYPHRRRRRRLVERGDSDANSTPNAGGADRIEFNIDASDRHHFYYKDDGVAGQVTHDSNFVVTTFEANDANITNRDPDWPHSWFSIQVIRELPNITEAVVIDGYTQGSATSNPLIDDNATPNTNPAELGLGLDTVLRIEIDGASATDQNGDGVVDGLIVGASTSTIRGLAMNRFAGADIHLTAGGVNVTRVGIEGNFLGTDVSGTIAFAGQGYGVNGVGNLFSSVSNNVVGGETSDARNLVTGFADAGVRFTKDGSLNRIEGNLIGTDRTGTRDISNGNLGVHILNMPDNLVGGATPVSRNVISGNATAVRLDGAARTLIQGNYVGTDVAGTIALGNSDFGIHDAGINTIIGGPSAYDGNIISANGTGLFVGRPGGSTGSQVQGNYIGTDVTGLSGLGNGIGIRLGQAGADADGNLIGGAGVGEGNVISANITGIFIDHANNNTIQGNSVGVTDRTSGLQPLGNSGDGIRIERAVSQQTIGGVQETAQTTLVTTSGRESESKDPTADTISILGNSIYANGDLGIDLVGGNEDVFGVTANDGNGDDDSGANELQNFPEIAAATSGTHYTSVNGTLRSVEGSSFRIEFFSNASPDPSGFGEGQSFLGFADVVTDLSGRVTFSAHLPVVSVGDCICATATDPNGNTSEFSTCIPVTSNRPPVATNNSNWINEDSTGTTVGNMIVDDDGFGVDSDPDDDMLSVVSVNGEPAPGVVFGNYGQMQWNHDGDYVYQLNQADPDVQGLAVDETLAENFSYGLSDGNGGLANATITITIHGMNDLPIVSDPVVVTATEDDAVFVVDLLTGASDPDTNDTLAVDGLILTDGDDRGVSVMVMRWRSILRPITT